MREISVANGVHSWPFSKGLVVESLLNAGVGREPAMAIARRVEQRLLDEQMRIVDPASLKAMVADEVGGELGPAAAARLSGQTSAFEDIVVDDGDNPIPFSKGILSRSLELAGISTKDAYELAKEVERSLRVAGVHHIAAEELEKSILEEVERKFGRGAKDAYLERWQRAGQMSVLEEDTGVGFPYSKGILAQSLMATGLSPVYAHRVAREVELRLWERGVPTISRSALRNVVEGILRAEVGEEFANRYRLLRSIRRPQKPIHLLIGGVTGTGKSFLAAEVAYRLGITRIESTDSVRQVMRAMISKQLLPELHASTFDAWLAALEPHEARTRPREAPPSNEELIGGFRDQVKAVSVGLRAIIERASEEHTSMLIEGVHVVPGYLPSEAFKNSIVVPMVIVVRSEEEHRKRFYMRDRETSQHRPMARYLRSFPQIRALQDYVERMARAESVPIIEGESLDRAADGVIEVVARRVLEANGGVIRDTPHAAAD
jgi:2-phosphoglycerate kinase